MEHILFVFTAFIFIINMLKVISVTFGSSVSIELPPIIGNLPITTPTRWYIFYPTLIYQIWFWTNFLNIV
jgi:hypothetical protein